MSSSASLPLPVAAGKRLFMTLLLTAGLALPSPGQENQAVAAQEKEIEKAVKITEEILVVAPAPKDQPVSSVTRLDFTAIERARPKDLAEVMRRMPGVMVTFGDKDTHTLKLRGMDAKRIALLVDGVPVYEPYYGSFDLKTFSAAGLDSVQVTRGPSSVLYGPNTLGGVVNIVTRRPGPEPFLDLSASMAEKGTHTLGLDGGVRRKKVALAGGLSYQDSDGFFYPDPEAGRTLRANSDYERFNLNAKLYYNPSDRTELMLGGGLYLSEYGMPPSLGVQRARYWRFKDWDRYSLNAGGFTSLGREGTLRFRAFYVNYMNTLDQWRDEAMSALLFESTFDNSVYGFFTLADLPLTERNGLKLSLNFEKDEARIQDDAGLPWTEFRQGSFSAAAEDHIRLGEKWEVVGGLSLDYLDKMTGGNRAALNPLAGVKFTASEGLDLHFSVSGKSRFPSMRSLYSTTSGNPDLMSERGTSLEAGFAAEGRVRLSGAAFLSWFRDMIDALTLPDGTRQFRNIGKAHIYGFEAQAATAMGPVEASLSYTYLAQRNDTDLRPLDALPAHSLGFSAAFRPAGRLLVDCYGLLASRSYWYNFSDLTLYTIPAYFNLDVVVSYDLGRVQVFGKASNVFDSYIYSEPVFPWRARQFEVGAKVRLGSY